MSAPSYTRDEWHSLHPWPSQYGDGQRVHFLWRYASKAAPEAVWRVLSDTSRVNRALGQSAMTFTEEAGRLRGRARYGGLLHEWWELPWNWVAGHWLEGTRVYERGLMKVMHGVRRIDEVPGGSVVHVSFEFLPRNGFGGALLRLGFASLEKGYGKLIGGIAADWSGLPAARPAPLSPEAEARLDAIAANLRRSGQAAALVDRLVGWIRTGDEQDLARIQLRERARAWSVDEDALLSLFLHATRAGLLDLSWDVVCPHCRGAREEHAQADQIPSGGSCSVCAIDFDTADAIEITFHVQAAVRSIEKRLYCAAEPATKSHVRVQLTVPAGETAVATARLAPGRYRTRLQGETRYGYLDAAEATGDAPSALTWRASEPPRERAASSSQVLRLVNDGSAPVAFVVEAAQRSDSALRPGRLLSFQEFRDLYSEHYLSADVQLSVGEQTILFTDLVGSTAMYAERGDPFAFVEVKKHFDQVFAVVARHRGAVVKTIGDAAMAAFNDPFDAVRAAKEIHDTFPPTRRDCLARLRISLNSGPCIAVRLNANIDYFGGTVNIAAKLQALAEAWQVAMTRRIWEAPGVAAWIAGQAGEVVDLEYVSKALPEPVPVKQWTVHRG